MIEGSAERDPDLYLVQMDTDRIGEFQKHPDPQHWYVLYSNVNDTKTEVQTFRYRS